MNDRPRSITNLKLPEQTFDYHRIETRIEDDTEFLCKLHGKHEAGLKRSDLDRKDSDSDFKRYLEYNYNPVVPRLSLDGNQEGRSELQKKPDGRKLGRFETGKTKHDNARSNGCFQIAKELQGQTSRKEHQEWLSRAANVTECCQQIKAQLRLLADSRKESSACSLVKSFEGKSDNDLSKISSAATSRTLQGRLSLPNDLTCSMEPDSYLLKHLRQKDIRRSLDERTAKDPRSPREPAKGLVIKLRTNPHDGEYMEVSAPPKLTLRKQKKSKQPRKVEHSEAIRKSRKADRSTPENQEISKILSDEKDLKLDESQQESRGSDLARCRPPLTTGDLRSAGNVGDEPAIKPQVEQSRREALSRAIDDDVRSSSDSSISSNRALSRKWQSNDTARPRVKRAWVDTQNKPSHLFSRWRSRAHNISRRFSLNISSLASQEATDSNSSIWNARGSGPDKKNLSGGTFSKTYTAGTTPNQTGWDLAEEEKVSIIDQVNQRQSLEAEINSESSIRACAVATTSVASDSRKDDLEFEKSADQNEQVEQKSLSDEDEEQGIDFEASYPMFESDCNDLSSWGDSSNLAFSSRWTADDSQTPGDDDVRSSTANRSDAFCLSPYTPDTTSREDSKPRSGGTAAIVVNSSPTAHSGVITKSTAIRERAGSMANSLAASSEENPTLCNMSSAKTIPTSPFSYLGTKTMEFSSGDDNAKQLDRGTADNSAQSLLEGGRSSGGLFTGENDNKFHKRANEREDSNNAVEWVSVNFEEVETDVTGAQSEYRASSSRVIHDFESAESCSKNRHDSSKNSSRAESRASYFAEALVHARESSRIGVKSDVDAETVQTLLVNQKSSEEGATFEPQEAETRGKPVNRSDRSGTSDEVDVYRVSSAETDKPVSSADTDSKRRPRGKSSAEHSDKDLIVLPTQIVASDTCNRGSVGPDQVASVQRATAANDRSNREETVILDKTMSNLMRSQGTAIRNKTATIRNTASPLLKTVFENSLESLHCNSAAQVNKLATASGLNSKRAAKIDDREAKETTQSTEEELLALNNLHFQFGESYRVKVVRKESNIGQKVHRERAERETKFGKPRMIVLTSSKQNSTSNRRDPTAPPSRESTLAGIVRQRRNSVIDFFAGKHRSPREQGDRAPPSRDPAMDGVGRPRRSSIIEFFAGKHGSGHGKADKAVPATDLPTGGVGRPRRNSVVEFLQRRRMSVGRRSPKPVKQSSARTKKRLLPPIHANKVAAAVEDFSNSKTSSSVGRETNNRSMDFQAKSVLRQKYESGPGDFELSSVRKQLHAKFEIGAAPPSPPASGTAQHQTTASSPEFKQRLKLNAHKRLSPIAVKETYNVLDKTPLKQRIDDLRALKSTKRKTGAVTILNMTPGDIIHGNGGYDENIAQEKTYRKPLPGIVKLKKKAAVRLLQDFEPTVRSTQTHEPLDYMVTSVRRNDLLSSFEEQQNVSVQTARSPIHSPGGNDNSILRPPTSLERIRSQTPLYPSIIKALSDGDDQQVVQWSDKMGNTFKVTAENGKYGAISCIKDRKASTYKRQSIARKTPPSDTNDHADFVPTVSDDKADKLIQNRRRLAQHAWQRLSGISAGQHPSVAKTKRGKPSITRRSSQRRKIDGTESMVVVVYTSGDGKDVSFLC